MHLHDDVEIFVPGGLIDSADLFLFSPSDGQVADGNFTGTSRHDDGRWWVGAERVKVYM